MQVGGGLTHLSIETAVMASRSLTQNSSRCDQPEKIITFGKQTCRLLDKTKPYQRRKLSHDDRAPAFITEKIIMKQKSNSTKGAVIVGSGDLLGITASLSMRAFLFRSLRESASCISEALRI